MEIVNSEPRTVNREIPSTRGEYFDFEKLRVYQAALDFVDTVFDLCDDLPVHFQSSIGDQFRRAALSITRSHLINRHGERSEAIARDGFVVRHRSIGGLLAMTGRFGLFMRPVQVKNIVEGSGKLSSRERKRYYSIAFDSARECVSICIVLYRRSTIGTSRYSTLRSHARDITNMLTGLMEALM